MAKIKYCTHATIGYDNIITRSFRELINSYLCNNLDAMSEWRPLRTWTVASPHHPGHRSQGLGSASNGRGKLFREPEHTIYR